MDGKLLFLGLVIGILILAWLGAGVLWRAAELAEIVAPLDKRTTVEIEVIAVGTGNEYENPERLGPTTAIVQGETVVLVDAGRGIAEALRHAKIPVDQPSLVLLTNLLPQNTVGLDDLLFTGWLSSRTEPLSIVGPTGTRALVESLELAHAAGRDAMGLALALPAEGGRLAVEEVGDGHAIERGPLHIEARALEGGPLPTLAWRFSEGQHRIVVSGSGWGRETLASFAANADALIHEAAYLPTPEELAGTGAEVPHPERLENEAKLHTSILDVGDLAREAQAKRLVLVRLRPPPFFDLQVRSLVAQDFEGEILVPKDGDVVYP
jgi:ribonuclease BN (tRNA processing enzyme)